MGSTPVGEIQHIPESDLGLDDSENQRKLIGSLAMGDQSDQNPIQVDTIEQMCLDMQQTHEEEQNKVQRRQFQASSWQQLGMYVLISYKDETYTNVGRIDKLEQDKDNNMKIMLTAYRATNQKEFTMSDAEIDTIETSDNEDPDVVEALIKGEGTDDNHG